jgi:NAD(P)-dependent dehydrogenase (short-subunit alcohol dehydrogenase family)
VDRDDATAGATARTVTAAGGQAIPVGADVGSPEDTQAMARAALDTWGTIDVLYANAGIAGVGTAVSTDLDEWDRVMRVNLTGVWLSMRAVLPTMVANRSGSCILQSSVGGIIGVRGIFPYATAKAGVIGMAKQAAADFGGDQIRVNAIAPGTARTALVDDVYATGGGGGATGALEDHIVAGLERARERYPMKRLGTVEDIANVALFLASDESRWVTGSVYTVDGGLSAV